MAALAVRPYDRSVFINCPFDAAYAPLFRATVFAVQDCGFVPRSALEVSDGAQVRFEKIVGLIGNCRFAIHDISRTELDGRTRLPRFNMPFELGVFLGAQRFGNGRHKDKTCLILDRGPFRYRKFLSDISGQDIASHLGRPRRLIVEVRDWLRTNSSGGHIPGGDHIAARYRKFAAALPVICRNARTTPVALTFYDYTSFVAEWLKKNAEP